MIRLYERHRTRKAFDLDGIWSFKTDPERKGKLERWFDSFPEENSSIYVPSCWNNEWGLYEYEGLAWYMTKLTTTVPHARFCFHGVTGQAEVYLDGKYLGDHYGGFTGFDFVVEDLQPGQHMLVVAVDNTHDSMNTIPLSKVDWFHYGGITRSVEVEELPEVWIKDHRIDYSLNQNYREAELDFMVVLEAFADENSSRTLSIYLNDKKIHSQEISVRGKKEIKVNGLSLKDIKLWGVRQPNLYYVRFEIEEDDIIERIGFREVVVQDKKLLLNGKEVTLKGVNRHEDHPDWGFALPAKLMKRDIDIIKNLGCNAVRGSHYPNAEAFLDYLDQEGLLFWEEIPMWGFPEKPLKNELIRQRGLQMHEEMVKRDYHHPSIILWSMHNEIDTRTQAAYEITKAFAEKVRSLDSTRPLTYASMFALEDICYPLVDIVSVNQYHGWYGGPKENFEEFLKALKEKLHKAGLDHMPIIISEFGAGAIYGDSTFEGPKWTENYQQSYLDYTLKLFFSDPDIIGTYIWQYCDIRTAKEMEMGRPRSFNNKGLVNEYRKPKLAYWTVQRIYKETDSQDL